MAWHPGGSFSRHGRLRRHHVLHESHFFELRTLTVEVEFIVTDEEARSSFALLHEEKIRLSTRRSGVFGVINPDAPIRPWMG